MELTTDHFCSWQAQAVAFAKPIANQQVQLQATTERNKELQELVEAYQQRLFGKKSEKMPRPEDDLRKRGDILPPDPEKLKAKRADGRKWKEELPTIDLVQALPSDLPTCDLCGDVPHHPLPSKITYSVELVPAKVVRHRHIQPQVRCNCGHCIVCAPAPLRVGDKVQYGPQLAAHLIVGKCMDAIAIERTAKQLARIGVPISANTLFDLFHRSAELITRLYDLLVGQVRNHDIVLADETRLEVQEKGKTRRAWMWAFLAGDTIVYVFSPSRSGQTPVEVLGASQGTLLVDAYTGYNQVTTPEGRERAGCFAHCRRKLFEAMKDAPDLQKGLDLILDLYKVEHKAKELNVVGTYDHLELRRTESTPAMQRLHEWLTAQQAALLPESKAGKAVAYMLNQWANLTVFLGRATIPIDNNRSERAMRVVARGRDSYLFVGNDQCGKNLAKLLTLVHTAAAFGHNPQVYMADVLIQILNHPVSRLDELLPEHWKPQPEPVPDQATV